MFCHKLNYCYKNKAIIKHLIENHNDNTVEVGAKILILLRVSMRKNTNCTHDNEII